MLLKIEQASEKSLCKLGIFLYHIVRPLTFYRLKAGFAQRHVSCLLNKNLMNDFLGNAKYTRIFAKQCHGHVDFKMTCLVMQNTHKDFPLAWF